MPAPPGRHGEVRGLPGAAQACEAGRLVFEVHVASLVPGAGGSVLHPGLSATRRQHVAERRVVVLQHWGRAVPGRGSREAPGSEFSDRPELSRRETGDPLPADGHATMAFVRGGTAAPATRTCARRCRHWSSCSSMCGDVRPGPGSEVMNLEVPSRRRVRWSCRSGVRRPPYRPEQHGFNPAWPTLQHGFNRLHQSLLLLPRHGFRGSGA